MSRPPIDPEKSLAGIAVDPQTLERVIPESRRPDGSVRKQIKIRPGFTPQEDVKRFRGTKQTAADASKLPKGFVVGWSPVPGSSTTTASTTPMTKSAKKNAKRREKKAEKKTAEDVPDNWDEDENDTAVQTKSPSATIPATDKVTGTTFTITPKADLGELTSTFESLKV